MIKIGDIAFSFLPKSQQNTTLFWHQPDPQTGFAPIAPRGALYGRFERANIHATDLVHLIEQELLFEPQLGVGLQMLQGTATTPAKVRAGWSNTLWTRYQYLFYSAQSIRSALTDLDEGYRLSWYRTVYKPDLTIRFRDTSPIVG